MIQKKCCESKAVATLKTDKIYNNNNKNFIYIAFFLKMLTKKCFTTKIQ